MTDQWFYYWAGLVTGLAFSLVVSGVVHYAICRDYYGYDEEWCGCDGEGMAHRPGAKGFACEVRSGAASGTEDVEK